MNRRGFLSGMGAIVGGLAIEQAIPLGRVWSFPTEIKTPYRSYVFGKDAIVNGTIAQYADWINFSDLYDPVIANVAKELAYREDARIKAYLSTTGG